MGSIHTRISPSLGTRRGRDLRDCGYWKTGGMGVEEEHPAHRDEHVRRYDVFEYLPNNGEAGGVR